MFGLGAIFEGGMKIADFMHDEEMQNDAQQFNSGESLISRNFNSAEALKNREFQREMSNTAVQRGVADMRAAGINPMLAVRAGGASSPVGGAASAGAASSGIASHGGGYSTAAALISAQSQAELNSAAVVRTEAEASKVKAEEEEIRARTPTHAVTIDQKRQEIVESIQRVEESMSRANLNVQSERTSAAQAAVLSAQLPKLKAEIANIVQHTKLLFSQVFESAQNTATGRQVEERTRNEAKANLPEIKRLLLQLEQFKLKMDQPRQMNEAGWEETLANVRRLQRLLPWPFGGSGNH